jgi:hypothetical protein
MSRPEPWAARQRAFAGALVDPAVAPPSGLRRACGFNVHRNNRMVALIDGLGDRFPVCARLVGDAFFRALARAFIEAHPPSGPVLLEWGDRLPAFIEQFAPAATLPCLADVARLEDAWSQAYHAAEAQPLELAALATLTPSDIAGTRVTLHPSLRLVRSPHPIASIWQAHQDDRAGRVSGRDWNAEDVLIVRPAADVAVHRLGGGSAAFVAALSKGATLAVAASCATDEAPGFDFGRALVGLIESGAVAAFVSPVPVEPVG